MSVQKKNDSAFLSILKGFIGSFRLMHFLPVVTTTTIGTLVALLILKGDSSFLVLFQDILSGTIPIYPLVLFALAFFFQQAFCGIQNDYLDREIDKKYNKRKAIADGWVSPTFAFWFAIACFILFTASSTALCFWAVTGFWGILFIQGANLIGVFYNFYAKHRPISIVPYFVGFPLIPTYAWITFGGFELRSLWMLPLLIFVSFPAHIANELPDYVFDLENDNRNFAVFLGKRNATIVYWVGIVLTDVIVIIVFALYGLNLWVFLSVISLSTLVAVGTLLVLWKKNWETDTLVFNLVTVCIGIEVIGFFILLGV